MILNQGIELHNVEELLPGEMDGEFRLSRLPDGLRRKLNEFAQERALETAGSELRFNMTNGPVRIALRSIDRPSVIEVWRGNFFQTWHIIGVERTVVEIEEPPRLGLLKKLTGEKKLPFDADVVRVLLPWRPQVRLMGVEGAFLPPRPDQTPSLKYLFHGSSITHGNATIGPSESFASITARQSGADFINLGFGAGAFLEPEIADYIAGRRGWDACVLEMGINLIRRIEVQEFEKRVSYTLNSICQAHADKLVYCIDLFPCFHDFENVEKIAWFREAVRRQAAAMRSKRVIHIPGSSFLNHGTGLTTDLVHPSPDGMREIAARLRCAIQTALC